MHEGLAETNRRGGVRFRGLPRARATGRGARLRRAGRGPTTRAPIRRSRLVLPLVAVTVLALSCSNHDLSAPGGYGGGGAGGNGGNSNGNGRETPPVGGPTAAAPGRFGTLAEPVCGPGDASGSTAQGVTDDSIKIGVTGDADNMLIPDLNKELFDGSTAFVAWCNDAGGINGRRIEMTKRDAGVLKAREVTSEACTEDFALVGGGLALDAQAVEVRTACGLPEFPGFANSVDNRESALQVQAVPGYKNHWTITQYRQIAAAFPGSIDHFGVMLTTAQLGSGRPYDRRLMDAISPLGYKSVYKGDLPPPPVAVDNWRPYVEEMKSKGLKVLDFEVTAEYLVPLLRTMRDVGWYPDVILIQANLYNQALLEAGDALKNVYVNAYLHPFELADSNPPTKQFLSIMDEKVPGWKRAGLAVNSFSAWLLFAQSAKACGSQLTRECVERNGLATNPWDGGGLHAPGRPDTKNDPAPNLCGLLLSPSPSGFAIDEAKTAANKGIYNCSTQNATKVAL